MTDSDIALFKGHHRKFLWCQFDIAFVSEMERLLANPGSYNGELWDDAGE